MNHTSKITEIFTAQDYADLARLFKEPGYKGYKPEVLEAPNGDGKVDVSKRYLHVALKYDPPEWAMRLLARAHHEACRIAEAMRVPDAFYPRVQDGTLRVLDYPAGAGSAEHTDFDLFTVHCFRTTPEDFVILADPCDAPALKAGRALNPGLHLGQLSEEIGLGPATRHLVPAQPYEQRSIVYFAMPALNARLRNGLEVREWLAERYSRSRVYR